MQRERINERFFKNRPLIKSVKLSCLIFLFVPLSQAVAGVNWMDGYTWVNQRAAVKTWFVAGWLQASVPVTISLPIDFCNALRESFIENMAKEIEQRSMDPSEIIRNEDCEKTIRNFSKAKGFDLLDDSTKIEQIVEAIDKIYSDPRVKTWEIFDVMPLVRGRLKGGWTEKDLDDVIAYKIKSREIYKKKIVDIGKNTSEAERNEMRKEIIALKKPKVLLDLEEYADMKRQGELFIKRIQKD